MSRGGPPVDRGGAPPEPGRPDGPDGPGDRAAEEDAYSTEEEDEVAARLEALGYLD
jgi:hypothetical protein